MIIDWEVYYDAAKKSQELATHLREADKPVHTAVLGECVGMAGDAPGCAQWGRAYDAAAEKTMQACTSLANALTNYGAVLYAQGHHYGSVNKSNPPRPDVTQVGDYKVHVPTSVNNNGLGFIDQGGVKGFFDKLTADIISTFGKLPNADSKKLDKAHTVWSNFAKNKTLTGAGAVISAISGQFDGMDDVTNRQYIQDFFATLKNSAETIVQAAQDIANVIAVYRDAIDKLGKETADRINELEAEVAATAVVGIALALFSVGTSAEIAADAIAIEAARTVEVIKAAVDASDLAHILGNVISGGPQVDAGKAFSAVPEGELDSAIVKLTAIIEMKAVLEGVGDGNNASGSMWDKVEGNKPPINAINVTPARRIHILDGDGDGKGGGHAPGVGIPGKKEFPETWDDDRIIREIEDVAKNPAAPPALQPNGRWKVTGTRDGVQITAIVNPDGTIWTGFPEGGPGVVQNPQ